MPDLSREEKIAGLKEVIKGYEKLAAEGRRPGDWRLRRKAYS